MQSDLEAKPVQRVDLYTSPESRDLPPLDSEIQDKLRRQFEKEFLISAITKNSDNSEVHDEEIVRSEPAPEPEDYEFRLFSKPAPGFTNSDDAPTRIKIKSPTPTSGEPGFIQPRRPDSYYFRDYLDDEEATRFRAAAVSGEDVLAEVPRRWPGNELPWRVTTVKATIPGKQSLTEPTAHARQGRKSRAGKKRRIARRRKLALLKSQKERLALERAEKEAAERDKRARRNREKKVKKREKKRLEKSEKEVVCGVDV